MPRKIFNRNLLYPELSYELNGIFFKVHNELGRFCNEKQYSDAIEKLLKEKNILYKREYRLPVSFDGEKKDRNIVDFFAENKVVLEVKAKTHIEKQDFYQIMRYLTALNFGLGIVVNFRRYYLTPKRIINPEFNSGFSGQ